MEEIIKSSGEIFSPLRIVFLEFARKVYYFCNLSLMLVLRETIIYRGRKAAKSLLKLPRMEITRDAR